MRRLHGYSFIGVQCYITDYTYFNSTFFYFQTLSSRSLVRSATNKETSFALIHSKYNNTVVALDALTTLYAKVWLLAGENLFVIAGVRDAYGPIGFYRIKKRTLIYGIGSCFVPELLPESSTHLSIEYQTGIGFLKYFERMALLFKGLRDSLRASEMPPLQYHNFVVRHSRVQVFGDGF